MPYKLSKFPVNYSNLFLLFAMFGLLFLPSVTEVQAKTVSLNKSVSSGKSTRIDTFMGWNNDCSFQTIDIDVVGKPTSGSARAKVINSKISKAQSGKAGKCLGRSIKGLGLFYKSKTGFHGIDNVKVKMKVRGQPPVTFRYRIKVR